ncbi:hypothetical protein [Sphingomonas sp.]|uniref:hypothetical protein n=1 Tax=Sphingomonas sp. TaxID=28214 RepID=UPI003B3AC34B
MRAGWIMAALLLAVPAGAAKKVRIPKDAPYCAAPDTRALFVSPMGEPFRGASGQPYPSTLWFAAADRNSDGAVDRVEFLADAARFFARLDTDHDGRLTPDEVTAYERDVAPEISLYAARRAPVPVRRPKLKSGESGYWYPTGAGQFAWLNIPQPVSGADADIDRVVTRGEFLAAAGRRFDTLDSKAQGRLVLAALPRTPQQAEIEGPCQPVPAPRQARR